MISRVSEPRPNLWKKNNLKTDAPLFKPNAVVINMHQSFWHTNQPKKYAKDNNAPESFSTHFALLSIVALSDIF